MRNRGRIRIAALVSGAASVVVLVVGCGGGKDFSDKPRPAAPVQLSGVITPSGITVSPNKIGAGPVQILISNQTQQAHTLTLDGANIAPVRTAPISPTDTGSITQTLGPGTYTVKAGSVHAVAREIAPAHLVIGKARPDSNDQVGLP
jgi:hypothetical protein